MIVRCWRRPVDVIIEITVANVWGERPLIGFSHEVEAAWEKLKKRHGVRDRHSALLCKVSHVTHPTSRSQVASTDEVEKVAKVAKEEKEREKRTKKAISKSKTCDLSPASEVGRVMLKFRELEAQEIEDRKEDVYSPDYVPKKYTKNSAEYGRPKPGSLTEKRAIKASKHIAREMLQMCEVIEEYGYHSRDGHTKITFGDLFNVYEFISDKVVGILLRARKHGMVSFEGEMLFQRRDEDVIITLLLSHEQIQDAIRHSTASH